MTNADAAALRSLALVAAQPTLSGGAYVVPTNGELLAFGAVSATGTYAANLTYLYRGVYGTVAGSHSSGDQFTVIDPLGVDGTTIAFDLPAQYVGQPIYLKLASFNLFGLAQQDLSTCAEYKYTPTGAGYGTGTGGLPQTPAGFAVTPDGAAALLTWNANPATDNVTSYVVYRAAGTGASFSSASAIWQGDTLALTDTPSSTPNTYFLAAVNAIGASAPTGGAVPAQEPGCRSPARGMSRSQEKAMSSFRKPLAALLALAALALVPAASHAQDSTASALPADTAPTAADNLYVEQGAGSGGSGCPGTPTSTPACNGLHLPLGTLKTWLGGSFAPQTSGSSILYGNGAGGFSSVTVGSGLSFTGGTAERQAAEGRLGDLVVCPNGAITGASNACNRRCRPRRDQRRTSITATGERQRCPGQRDGAERAGAQGLAHVLGHGSPCPTGSTVSSGGWTGAEAWRTPTSVQSHELLTNVPVNQATERPARRQCRTSGCNGSSASPAVNANARRRSGLDRHPGPDKSNIGSPTSSP